jgi:hypothetical protein
VPAIGRSPQAAKPDSSSEERSPQAAKPDSSSEKIKQILRSRGIREDAAVKIAVALTANLELTEHTHKKLMAKVALAIAAYQARVMADKQEHPAKIIATLRQGPSRIKALQQWLDTLPEMVRPPLRAGGLEQSLGELTENIEAQTKYWRRLVARHRPTGAWDARVDLYKSLDYVLAEHIGNERKRRRRITGLFRGLRIIFPDGKKNRKRLKHRKRRPAPANNIQDVEPESEEARERAKRLEDEIL